MGGMTPDTHDRPHGLRPQGRPSPQDEALQGMTLLNASCKTSGRYPKDTMRSVRICMIPRFLYSVITFRLSLRSNQLVTLLPELYKVGRDPLQTHAISYDS